MASPENFHECPGDPITRLHFPQKKSFVDRALCHSDKKRRVCIIVLNEIEKSEKSLLLQCSKSQGDTDFNRYIEWMGFQEIAGTRIGAQVKCSLKISPWRPVCGT